VIELKSSREIEIMREAGRIVAETLDLLDKEIKPGVRTADLDRMAEEFIRSRGGTPSFKGYRVGNKEFPSSLCISIEDVVVHGIPGERKLQEGEIVSIDCGVFKNGYHGDSARTMPVGEIDETRLKLLRVTQEALQAGIAKACAGNHLGDVSAAIQTTVEQNGFSVVRDMVGHGIGRRMHEEPQVMNFGKPGTGTELKEGLVIAIEPMVNVGGYKINIKSDGWTTVTADGTPSAHFEHTVAVTGNGPDILTLS
jgi:methionyl aminopeptidase